MKKVNYNKNTSQQTKKKLLIFSSVFIVAFALYNGLGDIIARTDATEIIQEKPDDSVEETFKPSKVKPIVQKTDEDYAEEQTIKATSGTRYGVATSNPIASQVGIQVLEDGGNAVDAAVAISYALNVTDPQNSGVGGGGGMLIYKPQTNEKTFYDYYISSGDKQPVANIGIPGFIKGLEVATQDFGTKPYGELIQYAIDLGEKGIEVTPAYAEIINRYNYITQVHPSFTIDGRILQEGDLLIQSDLMETFKAIRDHGSDVFYSGEHEISKNFLSLTGISPESLANYKVHKYAPLEASYRGYDIMAAPAPFSGMSVLQDLILEEQLNLPQHDLTNPEYNIMIKNILKFVGVEGRKLNTDPAFNTIDAATALDPADLLRRYNESIESEDTYEEPESESTTSFSVIDKDGMVVTATNTISNFWGSYSISNGIIYNNAMKNFSSSGVNAFEFNKRPKTGISPLVIVNPEGHVESLGTNGGAKIPTYLFMHIVNTKKYGMSVQQANDMERFHYTKGLMHYENGAPYTVSGKNINFDEPYTTIRSSEGWGVMNGLEFKANGEMSGHSDNRNYFEHGAIYSDGTQNYTN